MASNSTTGQLNVRIDKALLIQLDAVAKTEKRAKGMVVSTALQQYFQAQANPAAQIDAILARLDTVEDRLRGQHAQQEGE